jgi:ribosomal protein S18 acetylase RimI-like enzyme
VLDSGSATIAPRAGPLSYGSAVAGDRIYDPDLARLLVLHEARAQQTPSRELRDLGDGWLFHDPSDPEPFWNRLIAPRWPSDGRAFDRRLDEVITLFATLARLPHVRPLPLGGEPPDLAARLEAAGFEAMGADRRMLLVDPDGTEARIAAAEARVAASFGGAAATVSRQAIDIARGPAGRRWGERRRWAAEASIVLTDAFGVDDARRLALENDVLACISRPGCSMLLVRVDGEPAAIARRATTPEGSYLSSIGTRPRFRRSGLGSLATTLLLRDALGEGSPVVHLAVEVDNVAGRRLYEALGFAVVGEPAPDLLLR